MMRWLLGGRITILCVGSIIVLTANAMGEQQGTLPSNLKAGFARISITPPIGTTMMGFGGRDMEHGCDKIHDDIHARALYLEQGDHRALIMGFDLCFLGREDADRFKGAIGRRLDLTPGQILLNTSHNHVGPSVGTWYSAGYTAPDRLYLDDLERAVVTAACTAHASRREASVWAGVGHTSVPLSRRKPDGQGSVIFAPNPAGPTYDRLPVCLFKDIEGKTICLLFSVSCHPSMIGGFSISAEYPGVAMRLLDEKLGTIASMFLQGVGGDAKPRIIGKGEDRWSPGTWEMMEETGRTIAREVGQALENGLHQIQPALIYAAVEMEWPLQKIPPRGDFEAIASKPKPAGVSDYVQWLWAKRQIELLDRHGRLPTSAHLSLHGIQIGHGLRLVGIEGEAVAEWGMNIESFFGTGVTFPLGYTDGQGLYLPVSRMVDEGGYEAISAWEYGYPAPLAKGMEEQVAKGLNELRQRGIE